MKILRIEKYGKLWVIQAPEGWSWPEDEAYPMNAGTVWCCLLDSSERPAYEKLWANLCAENPNAR